MSINRQQTPIKTVTKTEIVEAIKTESAASIFADLKASKLQQALGVFCDLVTNDLVDASKYLLVPTDHGYHLQHTEKELDVQFVYDEEQILYFQPRLHLIVYEQKMVSFRWMVELDEAADQQWLRQRVRYRLRHHLDFYDS